VSWLAAILAAAAEGRFPPADGSVTVVAQPTDRDAGVIAFTAHSVIFTDQDPAWIHATLAAAGCDSLAAAMNARFLAALLDRTGRTTDTIDLLSAAPALPGDPPLELTEIKDEDHPRVRRALAHRDDVQVWAADGGLLVLGRGVAGRWETAIEVYPQSQQHGLGRTLARAARHLVPPGAVVWSQVAAGNTRSQRAFQAAGYRPIAAESLHTRV
jgi:GNAT superfamily N-acetyltransferase